MKPLVAIPVYNEERCIGNVLKRTLSQDVDILVVDDGSTDGTPAILASFPHVRVVRHRPNRGYGAALISAFTQARELRYEVVITMDSDGQHEPSLIPSFLDAIDDCDIVSGSRYLRDFANDSPAPAERRRINQLVTEELNACFHLDLTDAFCGFKAYRTDALAQLQLTEPGYGMPLELWAQAACHKLRIKEVAVPRVYLDPNRSFGESLDDADKRLAYYQSVIDKAVGALRRDEDCEMMRGKTPDLQRTGR
jgi:glycosyltransferase involved in cell wall biosynthesis